jgi:hypothetical protein
MVFSMRSVSQFRFFHVVIESRKHKYDELWSATMDSLYLGLLPLPEIQILQLANEAPEVSRKI